MENMGSTLDTGQFLRGLKLNGTRTHAKKGRVEGRAKPALYTNLSRTDDAGATRDQQANGRCPSAIPIAVGLRTHQLDRRYVWQ